MPLNNKQVTMQETETETRTQERPWECESCGMVHTHYRGVRHSLRGMAAGPAFVLNELEYNPDCHCGIHEMVERAKTNSVSLPSGLQDHITRLDQQLAVPRHIEEEIAECISDDEESV